MCLVLFVAWGFEIYELTRGPGRVLLWPVVPETPCGLVFSWDIGVCIFRISNLSCHLCFPFSVGGCHSAGFSHLWILAFQKHQSSSAPLHVHPVCWASKNPPSILHNSFENMSSGLSRIWFFSTKKEP